MFSNRLVLGIVGLALLGLGGWMIWEKRREGAGVRQAGGARLALLPCENQTGPEPLRALAAAAPRVLQMQMESVAGLRAFPAGSASEALAGGATHLLHMQLTAPQGRAALVLRMENAGSAGMVAQAEIPVVTGSWRNTLNAAGTFAMQALQAGAGKLLKLPEEKALVELIAGYAAASPLEAQGRFEASARADASCGWCWVAWAEVATRSGGKPAGQLVLGQYRQARAAVDAGSAARLDLLEAGFAGDRQREVQALWKLAELRPNDVASLLSLADLAQRLQQNDQAEKALLRVVRLEPGLAPQWNTLAYVQAYQGKTEAALQSAAEYEKLDPGSPNPLDSRGEILFMAGRFAEAESAFLACARKEPDFNSGVALEKAALARMLGGDVGGAGAIAGRYLQQRGEKQDALTAFHQARWDWLLGRRGPALQRMQALAQSEGVSAGLAAAKMAVWAMETGDEGAAREWAQLSAKKAKRPGDQLAAAMALSVAGFGQTVRGLPPQAVVELEAVRRTWKGEFGPASELWEKVEKSGGIALGHTVGGWAYLRAGRAEDARRCAASPWPILTTDQLLLFDSTVFQSALYLRAEAAQGAKQTAEARKYFDVYLRSMGDAKDRFGQLAKARGEARL